MFASPKGTFKNHQRPGMGHGMPNKLVVATAPAFQYVSRRALQTEQQYHLLYASSRSAANVATIYRRRVWNFTHPTGVEPTSTKFSRGLPLLNGRVGNLYVNESRCIGRAETSASLGLKAFVGSRLRSIRGRRTSLCGKIVVI